MPWTISDEYELEEELSVTVPLFEKLREIVKSLPAFIVREPDDSTVRFVTWTPVVEIIGSLLESRIKTLSPLAGAVPLAQLLSVAHAVLDNPFQASIEVAPIQYPGS